MELSSLYTFIFFRAHLKIDLPSKGSYATGILFLNHDEVESVKVSFSKITEALNLKVS